MKLDHAAVLSLHQSLTIPTALVTLPTPPRKTGGGGAHRCLLSFLFAPSPLSTGCTPQQVFIRELRSVGWLTLGLTANLRTE